MSDLTMLFSQRSKVSIRRGVTGIAATYCDMLAEVKTTAVGAGLIVDPKDFAEATLVAMQLGSEVRRLASVVAHAAHIAAQRVQLFRTFAVLPSFFVFSRSSSQTLRIGWPASIHCWRILLWSLPPTFPAEPTM